MKESSISMEMKREKNQETYQLERSNEGEEKRIEKQCLVV